MDTLLLNTNNDPHVLAEQGFSGSWSLNASRAIGCDYLVICAMGQGTGVLVGKIKGVMRTDDLARFNVHFSHFAHIDVPNAWNRKSQNPVGYTPEKELQIDFQTLDFKPVQGA